jgi:NAD(P)-dependent dehydrogenase (short-subunit alcohol dehydrogenase family)
MSDRQLLSGRKAIVTGGASGIGEAIVKAYAREGAQVLVVDLPDSAVSQNFAEVDGVTPLEQDITEKDAPQNIVSAAMAAMGGFDVLVNNAGISMPDSVEGDGEELWEKTMAINVTSMFRITRAALPELKKSDTGRIINLGSIMSDMGGPNLFRLWHIETRRCRYDEIHGCRSRSIWHYSELSPARRSGNSVVSPLF